ncbi:unnamed protein product [Caretta caretta]
MGFLWTNGLWSAQDLTLYINLSDWLEAGFRLQKPDFQAWQSISSAEVMTETDAYPRLFQLVFNYGC